MPDFEQDPATGRVTIHYRKGAQVARTATLNSGVAGYDANGLLVFYQPTSPLGASGINITGLPDKDALKNFLTQRAGKKGSDGLSRTVG